MLTTEEQELVLRVHGAAEVERLTHALGAEEDTLRELGEAYQRNAITEAQYEAQVKRTAASVKANTAELAAAKTAAGGAEGAIRGLNGTIRNLGFGVSDVFSNNGPLGQKIQGFANNVGNISTGILQMLGKTGPAALAAAAGLEIAFTGAGAALTALGVKSVNDFLNLFGAGVKKAADSLDVLKARISELEDKPHLIPVEMVELDNAKKRVDEIKAALEAVKRLETGQTEAESKSGKAVGKALSEAKDDKGDVIGAPGVRKTLRAQIVNELQAVETKRAQDEQNGILKDIENLKASMPSDEGGAQAALAEIAAKEKELKAAREKAVVNRTRITTAMGDDPAKADLVLGKILTDAEKGHGEEQAAAQRELAERTKRAGLSGVATEIGAANPADVAARELRKRTEEKLQQLRTMLEGAEETEAQVAAALKSVAGKTDKELDRVIADTRASIAAGKREKAKADEVKRLNVTGQENQRKAFDDAAKDLIDDRGAELKAAAERAVRAGKTPEQARAAVAAAALPFAPKGPAGPMVAESAAARVVDDVTDSKGRKRLEQQDKGEAFKAADEQHAGFNRQVDAGMKRLGATPIDEQADAAAAQYRAQGGITDRNGRVQKADETGQFVALAEDLRRIIGQANPGMSRTAVGAMASQQAMKSFSDVDDRAEARRNELARSGLSMNQAGQQAMAETVAAMQALAAQAQQSQAVWGQLAGQARQIRESIGNGKRRR